MYPGSPRARLPEDQAGLRFAKPALIWPDLPGAVPT